MLFGKEKFLPFTTTDGKLMNAAIADEIMAAPHDAGMTELSPEIIVPQVCMGIKLDDVQIRV